MGTKQITLNEFQESLIRCGATTLPLTPEQLQELRSALKVEPKDTGIAGYQALFHPPVPAPSETAEQAYARGRSDERADGMQSLYNRIAQLAMTGVHVKTGQKLRELKTSQIVCHAHAELSELYYAITQPEKDSTASVELEIGDVLAILIHLAIRHNITLSKLIEATNYKLDARFIDERADILAKIGGAR